MFAVKCEFYTSIPLETREQAEVLIQEVNRLDACVGTHKIVEVASC